tara:strand:- start:409 stop:1116 length:708 start_codon:yes stop_codon:yes gene_type:complete
MSEKEQVSQPQKDVPAVEVKETQADNKTQPQFTQEQVDKIIQTRLGAEKAKQEKALAEIQKKDDERKKEQEIKDAKTKADLEKLMQERIASKDADIQRLQNSIKKEKIDNSVLSIASKHKAINPAQVVELVKNQVRLSDDNRIEILDNNSNIRYNSKGELFTIEDRVVEFLDANPHFRQGSLAGSGSQSALEGKTVKPFNIQDLDMSKPEDRKRYAEYRKIRDSKPTQINLNNKQ